MGTACTCSWQPSHTQAQTYCAPRRSCTPRVALALHAHLQAPTEPLTLYPTPTKHHPPTRPHVSPPSPHPPRKQEGLPHVVAAVLHQPVLAANGGDVLPPIALHPARVVRRCKSSSGDGAWQLAEAAVDHRGKVPLSSLNTVALQSCSLQPLQCHPHPHPLPPTHPPTIAAAHPHPRPRPTPSTTPTRPPEYQGVKVLQVQGPFCGGGLRGDARKP